MMMKYCLLPLGCQMNKSDSERVARVLEGMGFLRTDCEEEADLLGIIACSVRQKSINKVYSRIQKWNEWKNRRNIVTFLSGCILPADEEKLCRQFDILFKINELPRLPEMIVQFGVSTPWSKNAAIPENSRDDFLSGFWKIPPRYTSLFEAYVPIQNGCNKFCSFCAVPYTRGREVSRSSEEILREIESLVEKDYKAITLLGQNVNSYGLDKQGKDLTFSELLEEIGKIGNRSGKEFWVYFTSPHPSDMKEDVLKIMAYYPCLADHVHLPIQSGDNEILQKMNRSYTRQQYRQVIENIRRYLPEATIFTDIIVGFSGETENQFQNTVSALQEFRFNMAYIAQYSPRPGAASYEWPDDVSVEEKKRRFHELTEELKKITQENNRQMIGKTYRVLVEGEDRKNGYLAGKTEGLIPVHFASQDRSLIGNFVDVRITSVTPFAVAGEKIL